MRIYLDTNILIPAMEGSGEDAALAIRLIDLQAQARLDLVTSEVTLSEVLVVPLRRSDDHLVDAYLGLMTREHRFDLVPVSREILIESSHIRARSSAKLPDSIHVATAVLSRCEVIVSYDGRLSGLSGLEVIGPANARFTALDEGRP
jgi:predicted nucleic acid-binding protein